MTAVDSTFDKIKKSYADGKWSLGRMKSAVDKKLITPEEYKTITGLKYEEGRK